ncbi:phosphodiester glycosidase family protein [Clostridium oceanicum]
MKKKRKRKKFVKRLIGFIIYEFLALIISGVLLTYYGPFKEVRSTLVGTAMATYKHQYIATLFLSKDKINEILNKDKSTPTIAENTGDIKINKNYGNSIERYDISTSKFDGYILEIKNPKKIKTGYTKYMGKMGQRTSKIAEENGAIAAINGGGFTDASSKGKLWTGTGANPEGLVLSKGKIIHNNFKKGEKANVTAFTKEGLLIVGNHTVEELLNMGVTEALSFRNTLIINGQPIPYNDGLNPRTAVGQKKDGTVVFLVIDGRRDMKPGATTEDVENILLKRGVVNAGNLDGGSSSTMYYKGKVINRPANWDGERTVATVLYVEP